MKHALKISIICSILFLSAFFNSIYSQIFSSPIIRTRGSISNSYNTFTNKKKGTVGFLGGSITHMKGWVDIIEKDLKMRFPDTEFTFINAGIPSIGSVPDAFRLESDVLNKGNIDLIFVEAAVNDNTNESSPEAPLKGMEGIIRHLLSANSYTDIIMLDFIYEPFIDMLKAGQEPDVILSHERVANYYMIPSIRLDLDIFRRLTKGELTWNQFGGTHPKPFGQALYASAINRLFDSMWIHLSENKAHIIPEKPLDLRSYYAGSFLDIHDIRLSNGWRIKENWEAPENLIESKDNSKDLKSSGDSIRVRVRDGFTNVPMLESYKINKKLSFDFVGNAIGIFCVAGPSAGIIKYRIDKQEWRELDTFTKWSNALYIPWLYILADGLSNSTHKIEMYMIDSHNPLSNGNTIQIRQFVVNNYIQNIK